MHSSVFKNKNVVGNVIWLDLLGDRLVFLAVKWLNIFYSGNIHCLPEELGFLFGGLCIKKRKNFVSKETSSVTFSRLYNMLIVIWI